MDNQQERQGSDTTEAGALRRRLNATRLRPRVAPPASATGTQSSEAEPQPGDPTTTRPVIEPLRADRSYPDPGDSSSSGTFQSLFGPRTYADGRVNVFGCSPGCLIVSILLSLFLTFFLNAIF